MSRSFCAGLLAWPLLTSTALGQPLDAGDPAPSPSPPTSTAVDAPESGSTGSPPDDRPTVDDPMLAPVPPPANVLSDWREALDLVRTRSESYITAQQQVEAARGRARMALGAVLPRLTADLQYTRYLNSFPERPGGVSADPENWSTGGTLRIPVVNLRGWYDHATSRRAVGQAALEVADAERLIIGDLAENLVTVITAERLSEVTKVNLEAALSNLDLDERRSRLGSGSSIDVLRARQEVNRSRAEVIRVEETLRSAREALGMALGYSEAWGVTPDLKLDQLRADARETCTRSEKPEDRADVRAAAAGAAIARRNVNSVMFSYFPLVDLTSRVNYSASNNFFFPDTTWTIGASLTWHLYDGGIRYGERRLNTALAEQAHQRELGVLRRAELQVTQSTRGVQVAKAALDNSLEARKIARDNANLARARFSMGAGTSFDMVDTQSTARQTEIDVTVKEFELLRAEIIAFLALSSCEI